MDILKQLKEALLSITNAAREEIAGFRTNRPTTKLVENVKVDYMGTPMELKQLGSITIELPRDIIVSPWDKSAIPMIEKAIQDMKTGLSAVSQTGIVRIKLPDLTEERKKELAKVVKTTAENAKIRIRMTRDDFNKRAKELKDEDAMFRAKDDIQKEVDNANKAVDSALEAKLAEMLE